MNGSLIIIGKLSLCGLFIALLVLYLNHILSNTRDRAVERRQKGKDVISAFSRELDDLHQKNDDCRHILTTEAYRRHESAIRSFLPHLSWINRTRLKRAWYSLAFHHKDKKKKLPFYEKYADLGSLSKRRSVRPEVIRKIERIFSFANR